MAVANSGVATRSRPAAWSGAIGNVVVENHPVNVTGVTYNGGAAGGRFILFDNATTNAGNIIYSRTLAAGEIGTVLFPVPLKARNGVTINSSAALGVGSIHAF
jgi:hypothetical protein